MDPSWVLVLKKTIGHGHGAMAMHPGWDATSLVAPPDADPDYYEDKKILDSRSGGFGGESNLVGPIKEVYIYIYINWKAGPLPVRSGVRTCN